MFLMKISYIYFDSLYLRDLGGEPGCCRLYYNNQSDMYIMRQTKHLGTILLNGLE